MEAELAQTGSCAQKSCAADFSREVLTDSRW